MLPIKHTSHYTEDMCIHKNIYMCVCLCKQKKTPQIKYTVDIQNDSFYAMPLLSHLSKQSKNIKQLQCFSATFTAVQWFNRWNVVATTVLVGSQVSMTLYMDYSVILGEQPILDVYEMFLSTWESICCLIVFFCILWNGCSRSHHLCQSYQALIIHRLPRNESHLTTQGGRNPQCIATAIRIPIGI